jgi:hypothetical protein
LKALHILLLSARGLTAFHCRRGEVAIEAQFQDCSDDFDAYLRDRADAVHALLVDAADETFETGSVPHVRGWGRAGLMTRRMERHGHGSRLCAALARGRQPDGRRDDRYLFAALTGRFVEPWLKKLEEAEIPLRGIYSMSQLAEGMKERVGHPSFILAHVTQAGLRQTFFVDGCLRFSRLIDLPPEADAASTCARENANLRRYLGGQRLVKREAVLPVAILAATEEMEAFRRHCVNDGESSYQFLDLGAEMARLRLPAPHDSRSDLMFVRMLAGDLPRQQFAPSVARRHWRFHNARRVLDALGPMAMAASLAFTALHLPSLAEQRDSVARLQADNETAEQVLRISAPRQGGSSSAAPELRELASATEILQRASPGLAPALAHLGGAMSAHSSVKLEAIEWRLADMQEQVVGPFAVLDVHGSFASETDPSRLKKELDRFVDRLRAPSISVHLVKQASALDSSQTIRSTEQRNSDTDFVLRVVQKL